MESFLIAAQLYWSIYTDMSTAEKLLLTTEDYRILGHSLRELSNDSELLKHCRHLARTDLYFLLFFGFGRVDIEHQWLLDRCKEIQAKPNGYLDLWSRGHYKSTIITYALSIQDILSSHGDDPDPKWGGIETTIGIFSCTRPIAKGFLRQIKMEFEQNNTLKEWFPDVIWENPKKDAPKWSEDDGIVLKRKTNPKESTVEAWGLVDGQPTSKHFVERVYDDVVTLESVRSSDMMKKTLASWEMSLNLGSANLNIERHIGTRYHFNDAYKDILKRGSAIERRYPATKDGTVDGEPVLFGKKLLNKKRRDMGPYTFGCFTKEMMVLKSDWTEQSIGSIVVGDSVVGYELGGKSKARLVPSKVVAIQTRKKPIVKITFESGRFLYCTEDHKFWSGRTERGYAPLSCGKKAGRLHGACTVFDPRSIRELKLSEMMFNQGSRNFGKSAKDVVVSIEEWGETDVYNIQTETGNYVCEGYAVKNCQMLINPSADKTEGFLEEWLRFYPLPIDHSKMNIVIIVDPANAKKKKSDYTSMKVIGFAADQNTYILAMVRDRLNLTERTAKVFDLHKQFLSQGKKIPVYYEQYGKDSDIQHIESIMVRDSYRFDIHAIGGSMSKEDRIRRLIPDFEQGNIYLPKSYNYVDYQHQTRDLTQVFIDEEYIPFPVGEHDDMLDDLARIKDINVKFPLAAPPKPKKKFGRNKGTGAWMG